MSQSQAPDAGVSKNHGLTPEALSSLEGTITRLRAELAGTTEKFRQARLLFEIGELAERSGDEPGAARDYLAAYNADPQFREPLEGLVRLLERRRSLKNLGRLVDALTRAAQSPDEKARAALMKAQYLEDVAHDLEGARAAAREATDAEAPPAEADAAWLALEVLAAKLSDAPLRFEALAERAKRAADAPASARADHASDGATDVEATWKGLLLVDVAKLAADLGEVDRALDALAEARSFEGVKFQAALATDRLVQREPGLPGTEEERRRAEVRANALEDQATYLGAALADPARGDALGVPRWLRDPTRAVDSWLRVADARRSLGELQKASAALQRAAEGGADLPPLVEAALLNARIRVAEMTGDTETAAALAAKRLESEKDGPVGAALAMRIAEHAANVGDGPRALDALSRAIAADPGCLPARALQLDLLADGGDATTFASQLESFADHLATDEARGRAFLLAAYVWGVAAGDAAGARAALSQAAMFGVPPATISRLARTMASVHGDGTWFEDATKRLLASGANESEVVPLWFELVRARFLRKDGDAEHRGLKDLGHVAKGAWLGGVLESFLPDGRQDGGHAAALDALAAVESDPDLASGLTLLSAVRAHASGDTATAGARLAELADKDPGDPLVAAYRLDLARQRGEDVAKLAADAGAAATDPALAAELHLEAGFARWDGGERTAALESFEEASAGAPAAARPVLAWAARGVAPDRVESRRQALERSALAGADPAWVALERLGTELALGDPDEAATALTTLEGEADGDLAVAAALARLAWSQGTTDADATRAAIARLATLGPQASAFVAAEQARIAQGGDAEELARAARAWFECGGGLAAALEWLAAALTLGDVAEERTARAALAASLDGEAREQALAAAHLTGLVETSELSPFIAGDSTAAKLANLENAPPGCDPRRRATALVEVDVVLGDEAQLDALGIAAWSALAAGDAPAAMAAFEKVTAARPGELAAWEGLRTCAELLRRPDVRARAAAELGARCADDERGAAFWEEAALLWLDLGDGDRGDAALDGAFERDPKRAVAFDKLFRRVRERRDGEKLLALVARRLDVTDDPPEMTKLFWEQARVLRERGDQEGALKSLENVTMLEPDHVGALALTGEIALKRGLYEEAATALARLSTLDAAPAKNRVTAGVAAVDIYENKLDRFDKALEVLSGLHKGGLSTLPVRERLARAAARTGSWNDATEILEVLMHERSDPEGRMEAARLAMAIHRDRLNAPQGARAAILKLLEEDPIDGEAIDMLLQVEPAQSGVRERLLEKARQQLVHSLSVRPADLPLVRRLAKVARATGDDALQQAALGAVMALAGGSDAAAEQAFAGLAARKARVPSIAIGGALLRQAMAPGDEGPVADLFVVLGPTLAEALGPSLQACGVTKKDKVDPRAGIALRNEIAAWAGAFGIGEFDLYVGGRDPLGVQGVAGEPPALVVGAGVSSPLGPLTRARVARELLALVRGSTIVRSRDDLTVASIVVAACHLAELRVEHPPYAILAEVEKLVSKAIARKTKKLLPDLCRAIVMTGADARTWFRRAHASHHRIAAIACGDVATVLGDVLEEPLERVPTAVRGDARADELLKFVLSPAYLELRRSFGLEGSST